MLIQSTEKNEKIVLGLLSYTYTDENPTIEDLKKVLDQYREDSDTILYLYKDADTENYVGIVVVEIVASDDSDDHEQTPTPISDKTVNILRLAVMPSFRNEGIGYKMYRDLKRLYSDATIIGTMNTVDVITEWSRKYNLENQ